MVTAVKVVPGLMIPFLLACKYQYFPQLNLWSSLSGYIHQCSLQTSQNTAFSYTIPPIEVCVLEDPYENQGLWSRSFFQLSEKGLTCLLHTAILWALHYFCAYTWDGPIQLFFSGFTNYDIHICLQLCLPSQSISSSLDCRSSSFTIITSLKFSSYSWKRKFCLTQRH